MYMTMTEFQLGFNFLGRRVEDKLCRCIDSVKFESESRFETSTYLGTVAIDGFHGTFYHGNWRALHHHAACWLVDICITWPLVAIDAMESVYKEKAMVSMGTTVAKVTPIVLSALSW